MKWRKDPSKQDGPISPHDEKLKLERQLEAMRLEIDEEVNGNNEDGRSNEQKTPVREAEKSNDSDSDRSDNEKANVIVTDT